MKTIAIGLLLIILGIAGSSQTRAANKVALVIGNFDYTHAGMLTNPGNDAQDIASALKQLGFDVTLKQNLSSRNFASAIADFSARFSGANVALFWYAGHGLQYQNESYLMPVDALLENEFAVHMETIRVADIIGQMEAMAKVNLVFLDACRNNPLADALNTRMTSRGRAGQMNRGLGRIPKANGDTLIIYSAAPGTIAADGQSRNSPFASAVLKHMQTPGLEVGTMLKRVRHDVKATTRGKQAPEWLSRLEREFHFRQTVKTASAPPKPVRIIPRPPSVASNNQSGSSAASEWSALDKTSRIELEIFMRRNKNSIFAEYATAYLDELVCREELSLFKDASTTTDMEVMQGLAENGKCKKVKLKSEKQLCITERNKADKQTAANDRKGLKQLSGDAWCPAVRTYATDQICQLDIAEVRQQAKSRNRKALKKLTITASCAKARDEAVLAQANLPECDGLTVPVTNGETACIKPGSGKTFRDCPDCPEMAVIPAGSFTMGSPSYEYGRNSDEHESPQHLVTFSAPFAVGKFEVTFAEWDACVADGGCKYRPKDNWGRGKQPVINVSWNHIKTQYLPWLNHKTGKAYRLLSEAEWEYAARAQSNSTFSWGNQTGKNLANCDGCGSRWDNHKTAPVGSFMANNFGLHDMHGNVWEWVEDCYNNNYIGAPDDGKAWTTGKCKYRLLRGGSWFSFVKDMRSANRFQTIITNWNKYFGFRVARSLSPAN